MSAKYTTEREGQFAFYSMVLPRIDYSLTVDELLSDNNDGVINGNLLEFKLNISDLNSVLFQCIKYLSALRIKGKPVPANILLIDLNSSIAYLYKSEPYLSSIEKVYIGGASKDNSGFIGDSPIDSIHYSNPSEAERLIKILKEKAYTKINIDENCIVGWATAYYAATPLARKEDFIGDNTGQHKKVGEIRNPIVFVDYINPYQGETNVKFNYLMDKLNDALLKKNLGAFYTHNLYAQKSIELLRDAIARVPEGNDYIILDRCAGTGNLEVTLSDEELSHCIVSTIEYYEYKVLQELIGSKVRHIIPPIETTDTFNAGLVTGADALSKEYIENPIIKQYIDNPNCSIIIFENPPYAETTSAEHQKKGVGAKSSTWKSSFAVTEMKKSVKGTASNDLGNVFIWSGFNYYLRQDTDSYVVYSPVKYWKAQHLINKKFIKGFAFNRRHFHTNIDACIMCALWSNENANLDELFLEGFDIVDGTLVPYDDLIPVKRIHTGYSKYYYDKRSFDDDKHDGILLGHNGLEASSTVKKRITPLYNENIIGYMVVDGSNFDNPDLHSCLLSAGIFNGNGFFLRKDNFLEKLPMFCASRYITYNRAWTERARIMKSADGAAEFSKRTVSGELEQFLLKCLLFTCLESQCHMRSFYGSDGRFYRNELCLDTTNGDTIASIEIQRLQTNDSEKKLLQQWNTLLMHAKNTLEYNDKLTYGVYQIFDEIDTSYEDTITGEKIYNNVEVHTALQSLKNLIKDYYNSEIVPTLFKYEFLK